MTGLAGSASPSEEDQGRPTGVITAAECRQGAAGTDGETIRERCLGRRDGGSVGRCVGDHDDNVLDSSVARLVFDPAELGLDVMDPSLGLRWDDAATLIGATKTTDNAVPCSQVVGYRQRNLEPEGQIWMQASAEARQQGRLSRIADRIRSGICANPDIQPHDRSDPAKLDSRDRIVPRPLDPSDLGAGEPGCATHLFECQTSGEPGRTKVGAQRDEIPLDGPGTPI